MRQSTETQAPRPYRAAIWIDVETRNKVNKIKADLALERSVTVTQDDAVRWLLDQVEQLQMRELETLMDVREPA